MAAAWLVARAELRGRWRALSLLVLVVGLGAGVTFSLAAGARRTASVVDRFRVDRAMADLVVQPDEITDADLAALRADPTVAAAAPSAVVFARVEGSGSDLLSDNQVRVAVALDETYGTALDRPIIVAGDPLDPTDPRAVEVSETVAATYDLEPGDPLVLETLSAEQVASGIFEGAPLGTPAGPDLQLRVSGVARPPNEVLGTITTGAILLTPAVWEQDGDPLQLDGSPTYGKGMGGFPNILFVRSRDGDVEGATAAARRIFAGDSELFVERTEDEAAGVSDLARVVAISLVVATVATAVTTAVVAAQAIARHMAARSSDASVFAAIGMPIRARVVGSLLPIVAAVSASVVLAVALAVGLSTRFPFGDLRRVEPHPGVRVDVAVLVLGAVAVVALLTASAWAAAWRAQRRRVVVPRPVPAAMARAPLMISTGVSLVRGRRAPIRPALGGAVVALAGVAAAATLGSSLARFVDEPARDGWGWDAEIGMGDGLDDDAALAAAQDIARNRVVDGVLLVRAGTLALGGEDDTQAFGLAPVSGEVAFTLLDGRPPRAPDEVVLGADTADARDAGIGDRFRVDGFEREWTLRVTGIGRFPVVNSDNPADGLAMTLDGLARVAPPTEDGAFGFPTAFVDLAPGVEADEVRSAFGRDYSILNARVKSTDVSSLEKVVGIPPVVAGVLAALGALGLAHAVIVATRRQRHDLAVLRAIGFVRRQVWSLVGVQAVAYCLVGVVLGVPLGIVVGRWTWRLLARQLGAADDPLTPATLLLAAPATVLLMGLLAVVVGWFNARGRPAAELRAE